MTPAIEIDRLSVSFPSRSGPDIVALDNISFKVETGQVFGFLGPNGAGKTTTLHVLLGFLNASGGAARIFGCDVRASIARERIGFLPEHPDAYRFLTGWESLLVAGRLFRLPHPVLADRIETILALIGLPLDIARRSIATYSRGQRQRICLAQALINEPDLLILDEPTGGLDPLGRREVRTLIQNLKAAGKTVFFSSHELSEVELVCDHVALLARGRIVAQGAIRDLIPPDERLEQYFLRMVQS
jgi:ABC-2 type transport system ATP-binding protein